MDDFMLKQTPTSDRPLLGITALVVEDSLFACEALRLLCQRSGARLRRADSIEHARKHLGVYRPCVIMIDVGLPDGSGLDLIAMLAAASPRIEVILGISGDPNAEHDVIKAGADGFIAKPIANLAAFQDAILRHLPAHRQPPGPRMVSNETINPDLVAYRDDLHHISEILNRPKSTVKISYVTQLLDGIARSAQDDALGKAAKSLAALHSTGDDTTGGVTALSDMVEQRIAAGGPL
ncbi:response regulator [Loktanella sp. D2R18]|uniref:response regulator n=1 Tax=Rhodobacterales TaxID=204455 RepID=UPI000DEAFFF3|nr:MULTISPECIES: response regulator [Rhodobacterales]MDO6589344.1 response regulator [Yoonia sp. 1_MG-2023]RBW45241.1 response regulator [Loktanella sp. D2R18]